MHVLGLFHRHTHLFYRAVHVFPSCTRYDHCTHCTVSLLQYQPCPFHGFLASIAVTWTQSNGDRVPAAVVSPSECGQYVKHRNMPHCVMFVGRRVVYAIPVANGFALLKGHFRRGKIRLVQVYSSHM